EREIKSARRARKRGGSAGRSGRRGFARLGGGRTRARSWEPLIKRQPNRIDFSRKFFQLSRNPFLTDQWLTAKDPTARARNGEQIDASETSVRVKVPTSQDPPSSHLGKGNRVLQRFQNAPKNTARPKRLPFS